MRIVNTGAYYDGNYPNEEFVLGIPFDMTKKDCIAICKILNTPQDNRYWKVVPKNYILIPGFMP